jgi:tripartite-type tricarboxylate transporter receptor subunit TctC
MGWIKNLAGVYIVHLPYKGVGPALADVLAGQVDLMFTGTSTASTHVKSGKLIVLAASSAKRQASFPDIPSVAES